MVEHQKRWRRLTFNRGQTSNNNKKKVIRRFVANDHIEKQWESHQAVSLIDELESRNFQKSFPTYHECIWEIKMLVNFVVSYKLKHTENFPKLRQIKSATEMRNVWEKILLANLIWIYFSFEILYLKLL